MGYDVLISHSSIDKQVAEALCSALEDAGVSCWRCATAAPTSVNPASFSTSCRNPRPGGGAVQVKAEVGLTAAGLVRAVVEE